MEALRAHKLISEVSLWLTTHAQATKFVRIAELRALQKTGSEFTNKIKKISTKIQLPEFNDLRLQLSNRLDDIKKALNEAMERASKLWETKLTSIDDVEILQNEVDELFSVFEGCGKDVDDLQIMRRALRLYTEAYRQLDNDRLTSNDFSLLADNLKSELIEVISEEESPWEPSETIDNFKKIIEMNRDKKSLKWVNSLEREIAMLQLQIYQL